MRYIHIALPATKTKMKGCAERGWGMEGRRGDLAPHVSEYVAAVVGVEVVDAQGEIRKKRNRKREIEGKKKGTVKKRAEKKMEL